jgi:SHS2 domain-containing protein
MFTLMGTSLRPAERFKRELELPVHDPESLLVDFLTELLYLAEVEGLGVANYHLQLEEISCWHRWRALRLPVSPRRSRL